MSSHFEDDLSIRDDVLMRAWLCMTFSAWCVDRSPWSRSLVGGGRLLRYSVTAVGSYTVFYVPLSRRRRATVTLCAVSCMSAPVVGWIGSHPTQAPHAHDRSPDTMTS